MSGKKGKGGAAKSAVHEAAADGDVDALREELAKDASLIAAKNKDGWTPLHSAAYQGQTEAVEFLVSAGANVNAVCNDGDTPLHYAAAQGEEGVINVLAKAKAKLELQDNDGETPLDVAKGKKVKTLLQNLIDKAAEEGEDDEGAGDEGEEEA